MLSSVLDLSGDVLNYLIMLILQFASLSSTGSSAA